MTCIYTFMLKFKFKSHVYQRLNYEKKIVMLRNDSIKLLTLLVSKCNFIFLMTIEKIWEMLKSKKCQNFNIFGKICWFFTQKKRCFKKYIIKKFAILILLKFREIFYSLSIVQHDSKTQQRNRTRCDTISNYKY